MLLLILYFHKAFDCLSWDFLFTTMNRMSFNQTWINWMKECLSTTLISVLVNGSSSAPFNMNCDVRQGDLLSPFLFIIAVEALKRILDKAREVGLINSIYISKTLPNLSLL